MNTHLSRVASYNDEQTQVEVNDKAKLMTQLGGSIDQAIQEGKYGKSQRDNNDFHLDLLLCIGEVNGNREKRKKEKGCSS